jgi:hypothetical protein
MAFGGFLKQSTAVDVLIGPFIDDTDGKTAETGLTLAQADIKLSKNGQALAQKNDATAASHDSDGYYNCELDATDTGTLGTLVLIVHESGALPVRHEFQVLTANAYDTLCSTDQWDVNVTNIEGSDPTDQIRDAVVDDTQRIDASALNTLSSHDPGSQIAAQADVTGLNDLSATDVRNAVIADGDGTEINAANLNTLSGHDPGENIAGVSDIPTVAEIQTEMEENGASLLDTIRDHLENGTYGLSALETLVDELESRLTAARAGYLDNLNIGENVTGVSDLPTNFDSLSIDADGVVASNLKKVNDTDYKATTTLSDTASSGDEIIYVTSATNISIGDLIIIETSVMDNIVSDAVVVTRVDTDGSPTLGISPALHRSFAASSTVSIYSLKMAEDVEISQVADAVWNEDITGHTDADSAGEAQNRLDDIQTDTEDIQTQIGTDGNGLTNIPWNADWDAEVQSEVQDAIEANHLDHLLAQTYDPAAKPGAADALLNEMVENDGGVSRFTINALENAPSGSGASAETIADAVWDEAKSGHTAAGSFGEEVQEHSLSSEISGLNDPTAAEIRAEIDSNSTKLSAIETDTNELQGDLADGGRLDLLIDAILEDTGTTLDTLLDTLVARLTAARAGYLDNLNIGENVAGASDISGLNDFDPASDQVTVETNNDKTGYGLSAAALSAIFTEVLADLSDNDVNPGESITVAKALRAIFNRFFRAVTQTDSAQVVKNDAGAQIASMAVSDDGTTQTKGAAS